MAHDSSFGRRRNKTETFAFKGGPAPGDLMPEFRLTTIEAAEIGKQDYVGKRPLLLTMASVTSSESAEAVPVLKRLYSEYGDRVAFVTLYTREANPSDLHPQPTSLEMKTAHARAYQERDAIPWAIAIDDLKDSLHTALDAQPNAAYLMDTAGRLAFRTLSSGDEASLREALQAIANRPALVPRLKVTPLTRETTQPLAEVEDNEPTPLVSAIAYIVAATFLVVEVIGGLFSDGKGRKK